ncbi:MAG: AAA family ATPase [Clostridium sp.]
MRFLDLHINGFGKFHDTSVSFEDGINIIYGKNEAGKSTIHTFIRGMLFGIERQRGRAAKNDLYNKYEPWENSGTYEGRLRLESEGSIYRIERSFQKNRKEFTIVNETTGREEEPTKAFMDELVCGLSETAYNNTISISQLKSATEDGMISELKNYIANMNTSGNMALNITKATAYLKNQRKQLETQLMPEAARTYTSLLSEIRNIDKEISSPEYENQMHEFQGMRQKVKEEIEMSQQEQQELEDKVTRGHQVLEEFEFTDEASITSYTNNTDAIYNDYKSSTAIAENKPGHVIPIILFILAVIGLAGTGYFGYWYYRPENTLLPLLSSGIDALKSAIASGSITLILFLTGLFMTLRRKQHEKEAKLCFTSLSEILKRHLGDSSISDEAIEALHNRLDEFVRLCRMILKSETTLKTQAEKISSLREKQNDCSEVIEQQQRIQWELEKKLEHLSDCKDRALGLKHITEENERLRQEIAAIDLAQDTMKELSMSIRDSFGLYLNKTASELIDGITGGIYNSISIDENLNAFLNTKKKLVPLEQVSSGTADQIYLALRLAAAKLIQTKEDAMPLIFDDSFVLYDDERLEKVLTWLPKAYKGQIIIFTCHRREIQILEDNKIKHLSISI